MRFFVIIWALYIQAMAILPCADLPIDNKNAEITQLQEESCLGEQHDPSHNHQVCSPICSCACCGIQLNTQVPFISQIKELIKLHYSPISFYQKPSIKEFAFDIFQPPRG